MTANAFNFYYPDLTEKGLLNKEQEYTISDNSPDHKQPVSKALYGDNKNKRKYVNHHQKDDAYFGNTEVDNDINFAGKPEVEKNSVDFLYMFARLSPKDDAIGDETECQHKISDNGPIQNQMLQERNNLNKSIINSSHHAKILKRQNSERTNYESWFINEFDPVEVYKTSTPSKLLKLDKEKLCGKPTESASVPQRKGPSCGNLGFDERPCSSNMGLADNLSDCCYGLLFDPYSDDKENVIRHSSSVTSVKSGKHDDVYRSATLVKKNNGRDAGEGKNELGKSKKSPYEYLSCPVKMSKTVSRVVPSKTSGKQEESVVILDSSFQETDESDKDAPWNQEIQENKSRMFESVVTPVSKSVNNIFEEVKKQKISLDDLPNPNKLRKSKSSRKQKPANITDVQAHQQQLHQKIHDFFGGTSSTVNSSDIAHRQRVQHSTTTPLTECKSLFDIQEQLISARSLTNAAPHYMDEQPTEADIVPEQYTARLSQSPFKHGHHQSLSHNTSRSVVLSNADYIENQALLWGSGDDQVRSSPFLRHPLPSSTTPTPSSPANYRLQTPPSHHQRHRDLESSFTTDIDGDYSAGNVSFMQSSFDSRLWGGSLFKPDLSPIPELGPSYKAFFEEE